jgi:hypothetical protein
MTLLELPLGALDRVRATLLRRLFAHSLSRELLGSREQRLVARFVSGLLASLAVVLLAPDLALVAAPLLFGVPHLVSELRFLVLGQNLERRMRWLVLGTSIAVGGSTLFDGPLAFRVGMIAIAIAAFWRRDALGRVLGIVLLAVSCLDAARGLVVLTHGVVSLAIWLFVLQRANARFALAAFGAVALCALVTLLPGGDVLLRVTLFLQGVHYLVWLALAPVPRSFRVAARAMWKDLGPGGLLVAAGAWLAVLSTAAFDATRARDTYLLLAEFHVYVEAMLFVRLVRLPCSS